LISRHWSVERGSGPAVQYRRPEIRGGKLTFGGLRGQYSKPAVRAAIDPDVERLAIITQAPAESVHHALHPLRWNPTILGDPGDVSSRPVAVAVAVDGRLTVTGDAAPVTTVHLVTIPVRHHYIGKLRPADATHFIGKNPGEQNEVSRILEIRQRRKHPQVGDLGWRDAVPQRSKPDCKI
jgi:hypothetical protein